MEVLGGGVVRAGCSHHDELLEPQLFFERSQCIDLTGNTNHRESGVALLDSRFQQLEQRGIAHAHAATIRHILGVGDEPRLGSPRILGIGPDTEYGRYLTAF